MDDPLTILFGTILAVVLILGMAASKALDNKKRCENKCLELAERVKDLAGVLHEQDYPQATERVDQRLKDALDEALRIINYVQEGGVFSGKYCSTKVRELDNVDRNISRCTMDILFIAQACGHGGKQASEEITGEEPRALGTSAQALDLEDASLDRAQTREARVLATFARALEEAAAAINHMKTHEAPHALATPAQALEEPAGNRVKTHEAPHTHTTPAQALDEAAAINNVKTREAPHEFATPAQALEKAPLESCLRSIRRSRSRSRSRSPPISRKDLDRPRRSRSPRSCEDLDRSRRPSPPISREDLDRAIRRKELWAGTVHSPPGCNLKRIVGSP